MKKSKKELLEKLKEEPEEPLKSKEPDVDLKQIYTKKIDILNEAINSKGYLSNEKEISLKLDLAQEYVNLFNLYKKNPNNKEHSSSKDAIDIIKKVLNSTKCYYKMIRGLNLLLQCFPKDHETYMKIRYEISQKLSLLTRIVSISSLINSVLENAKFGPYIKMPESIGTKEHPIDNVLKDLVDSKKILEKIIVLIEKSEAFELNFYFKYRIILEFATKIKYELKSISDNTIKRYYAKEFDLI